MTALPLIIAHRGASAHAPENTLAAFRMAVDAGADGIEFDVRLAKDGVPVVIHDATLKRTGRQSGNISQLTSSQLGKVDAGTWFNKKYPERADPEFACERIPNLMQTLKLLGGFRGLIYIELKTGRADSRRLIEGVCEVIQDSPLLPRIILKCFRLAVLPEIKHYLPNVQAAALFGPSITHYLGRRKQILALARDYGSDQISLHYSLATTNLVSLANIEQVPVTIWTVDRPKWLNLCRARGINALITNDPAVLMKHRSDSIFK